MDPLDHDLDDPELTRALGEHAAHLTGPLDVDAALTDVTRRARVQRRRRYAVVTGAAAAAVVAIVGLVAVTGGDREVLRAPATQPAVDTTRPDLTIAPPSTSGVVTPTIGGPTPATTISPAPITTAAAAPPVVTTGPTATEAAPAPTTSTYTSAGGSITVRVADGRIALVGEPTATTGWEPRIDDDGPDRVRVRFELDDRRSEIRVELEDGRPVEQIIES